MFVILIPLLYEICLNERLTLILEDGYIAGDCPCCGFHQISCLSESLLENESEEEKASWVL